MPDAKKKIGEKIKCTNGYVKSEDYGDVLKETMEEFASLSQKSLEYDKYLEEKQFETDNGKENIDDCLKFFEKDIRRFRLKVMDILTKATGNNETKWFQYWGNNIRRYGTSYISDVQQENPSYLAHTINILIKLYRKRNRLQDKSTFILIDSLRNPFEVLYFRERYSAFYLMSITTTENERKKNLSWMSGAEIEELDKIEYPEARKSLSDSYFEQDVEKCVEMSDIHIAHNNEEIHLNKDLKQQLVHFISLMLHPGLVMPTPVERLMQIANTAKLNSGCISRQVGAAICDSNFSLKAIGWNTAPQGQTPCSLRSFDSLLQREYLNAYSDYELKDEKFRGIVSKYGLKYAPVKDRLHGIPLSYCSKDFYIALTKKKNQVHTRSLHAEENSFLQLAKYGSQGIEGGYLFTTASPCELCAKKAYQLGIKKIYYIDIYHGISAQHILGCGDQRPELIHFRGAIGRAYERLYTPFLPLKDEIEYQTKVKVEMDGNKEKKDNENIPSSTTVVETSKK